MPQRLKIAVKPTFSAPVVMRLPGDNGQAIEVTFNAVFRRLSRSENLALDERIKAQSITDAELLGLVLVGWDGLSDEDGDPFEYHAANLAAAVEAWPRLEWSIAYSYFQHVNPAIEKN